MVPCARTRAAARSSRPDAPRRARVFGYNKAASHTIVDIAECPILLPEIEAPRSTAARARRADRQHARRLPPDRDADRLRPRCRRDRRRPAVRSRPRRAAVEFAIRESLRVVGGRRDRRRTAKTGIPVRSGCGQFRRLAAFFRRSRRPSERWPDLALAHLKRAKKVADLFAGCRRLCAAAGAKCGGSCGRGRCGRPCGARSGLSARTGLKRVTGEKPRSLPPPVDLQGAQRL